MNPLHSLDICKFLQTDKSLEPFPFDLNSVPSIEVHSLVNCENENPIPTESDNSTDGRGNSGTPSSEGCVVANSTCVTPSGVGGEDVPPVDGWESFEWKTFKEVKSYYKSYGHSWGFSTKTASANRYTSTRDLTDKVQYAVLSCNKQGFRKGSENDPKNKGKVVKIDRQKEKAETRVGCKALMRIKFVQDKEVYIPYEWCFKHNHSLTPPHLKHFMKSSRQVSETHMQIAKMHDAVGISTRDSYDFMAMCSGGPTSLDSYDSH